MSRLLLIGPLPASLHQVLVGKHELTPLWEIADTRQFLADNQGRFDAGVTMAKYPLPEGTLEALQGKALISYGVGTENLQVDAAQALNVQLSNTPDTATTAVAEMAVGLMLATSRRIVEGDRYVRSGEWPNGPFKVSTQLSGKRLGIVGLGRIGQEIARMAAAFRMHIGYNGRRARTDVDYTYFDTPVRLAEWCDFLVLCCPGGPTTHHLVNAEVLNALGKRGYLINVARGSVVNETALIQALEQRSIAGAGLDVYNNEPKIDPAFQQLNNLVMTPHVAAVTHEGRAAMEELVLNNLEHFLTTGSVLNPVKSV